jgi:hypothetical protein
MKLKVKCSFCNKELEIYPSQKRYKTHFCDVNCKANFQKNKQLSEETKSKISKKTSGKNNGMFGKNHSTQTKEQISKSSIEKYKSNPDLKFICGNSRLSKEDRKKAGRIWRSNIDYSKFIGKKLSKETKEKIGKKSKEKFTTEYLIKQRKKFEGLGLWISLEEKDDYLFYKDLSNWNDKIFDRISDKNQINLLNEHRVFNVYNNKKGVVRDHMYSRWSGFNEKVFPEILRHPANCEILLHADNLRKKRGWVTDKDSIILEDLFKRIKTYSKEWKEQDLCLLLIEKYKLGERYIKQNYIKTYYERH